MKLDDAQPVADALTRGDFFLGVLLLGMLAIHLRHPKSGGFGSLIWWALMTVLLRGIAEFL